MKSIYGGIVLLLLVQSASADLPPASQLVRLPARMDGAVVPVSVASASRNTGLVIRQNNPTEYVIDQGRKQGLSVGDRFELYMQEADVAHPRTGAVMKGGRKIFGQASVVQLGDDFAMIRTEKLAMPIALGATRVERLTRREPAVRAAD